MNYLFYDYETSGTNEKYDQIFQFAAIKTDEEFNKIGEPIEYYCRLRLDILPSPHAIKVNQIDINDLNSKGLSEFEFAKKVSTALIGDGSQCISGYNSKGFDNNFTRFLLYRNFLEPYAWAYNDGNFCLDVQDIVCLAYSFNRLGNIRVASEEGKDSIRLENLATLNELPHTKAHDAVSDVEATIGLVKMLNKECPKVVEHVLALADKNKTRNIICNNGMFFYSSTINGYERNFQSVHSYLVDHPTFLNSVIGWNLENDPNEILDLSAEEIRNQMYAKGELRTVNVGFSEFKLNKSPMVVPFVKKDNHSSLNFEKCVENQEAVKNNLDSLKKLASEIYRTSIPEEDPDADLYAGDFFSEKRADEGVILKVREDPTEVFASDFRSMRFKRQLKRLKARNFLDRLSDSDQDHYKQHCLSKLSVSDETKWRTQSVFKKEFNEVIGNGKLSEQQNHCLTVLRNYVESTFEFSVVDD